ncbi:F-box protein [Hordeum vulgare]|uniref:Predicted protein n=1 Tax=Hordeum vulgare subsp. vulgare TaxID=112509 RepID=F2CY38_HORVV|nr:F-box protein At4g00755-like [Hordeum vulgare subsp. vulgare]KAE8795239.1 F-box protein [Hordeum vulgare]BAJ87759.1 predicted protein [Hordeum vulgare subsp. vulgare]
MASSRGLTMERIRELPAMSWEEGRGLDFLESLGPDNSATVFSLLDDPADLARATAVSRSWRRFVIANQFSKLLCLRVYPEVSNFTRVELGSFSNAHQNAGSSDCAGLEKLGSDHRVYMHLSHGLLSPYNPKDCINHCVGASSTDHFPEEAIGNTLEPVDRDERRPSYWSSGGHKDPAVPECLIYRLQSELCLVDEIKIRPFKAFFRRNHPIYSAKHIRFHMGYVKPPLWSETHVHVQTDDGELIDDSNYIWTYTSPEFPMLQENVMQSFKLPHPVLCIGGVVKIELLGRVHKDTVDGLYYICVSHVQIVGKPLSQDFGVAPSKNDVVLSYYLDYHRFRGRSQ